MGGEKKKGKKASPPAIVKTPSPPARPAPRVSQWVKVNTSLSGDDEFSVFSVDPNGGRRPDPVDLDITQRGKPEHVRENANPGLLGVLRKLIKK